MENIEKFVDKWVEEREPVKGGNSAYDYSLDKSDLFHLVRDFSEQEWHTPDEKPEDENYDDDIIIGYYCLGCGHIQTSNDWGGQCMKCTGMSLDPIYE